MPPQRTKRSVNPSVRRRELARQLLEFAMRPCANCTRLSKQCMVGPDSDRCSHCVQNGKKCDLSVSPAEMRRIENERVALIDQLADLAAKTSRLHKQLASVEKRKKEVVERELKNIEELEADERAAAPTGNDLLFDVSSEHFEIPENFDWSAVIGKTPLDVLRSSPQGS